MRGLRYLVASCLCMALLGSGHVFAEQSCADKKTKSPLIERFCAADTNASDTLTQQEFSLAFPDMTEQAFEALDTNHDGVISIQEWNAFMGNHGKKSSKALEEEKKGAPLLIQPPAQPSSEKKE